MKVVPDFYEDLEAVVNEAVCVNYNTKFDDVAKAVIERFGDSDIIGQIMTMAEEMFYEIQSDLYEFWDD